MPEAPGHVCGAVRRMVTVFREPPTPWRAPRGLNEALVAAFPGVAVPSRHHQRPGARDADSIVVANVVANEDKG